MPPSIPRAETKAVFTLDIRGGATRLQLNWGIMLAVSHLGCNLGSRAAVKAAYVK